MAQGPLSTWPVSAAGLIQALGPGNAGTSILQGATLITPDARLRGYAPVKTVWD